MIEEKLVKVASELFNTEITIDSQIGQAGSWDSLGQINLFMAIEEEFGMSFTTDEVIENNSIEKIINLIKSKNN